MRLINAEIYLYGCVYCVLCVRLFKRIAFRLLLIQNQFESPKDNLYVNIQNAGIKITNSSSIIITNGPIQLLIRVGVQFTDLMYEERMKSKKCKW